MIARYETTAGEIALCAEGKLLCGDASLKISRISSDSRGIERPCLFVPLNGEKFDGHDFIEDLCRNQKIDCFLTSRPDDVEFARAYGVTAILCENTLYALGSIARAYRKKFSMPVIGVTGTNGKTTTKELIACAFASSGRVMKSEKNYNNEIGVPFTLFGLSSDDDFAVIEMGMNHAGEISRLTSMVIPDCAVITNAGEGHLEFLGSVENVAHAKSEIMESMKPGSTVILNEESECFDIMHEAAKMKTLAVKTIGIEKGMFRPESYMLESGYTSVTYRGIVFRVPLYGIHNIHNIMAAIVAAESFALDLAAVARSFEHFQNVGKRSDLIEGDFVLINDTYNSNPLSLRYALRSLAEVYPSKRKIAVLSDMKELGEHSERCHRNAGREVHAFGYDFLYTWGDMSMWTAEEAVISGMDAAKVKHFAVKDELIRNLTAAVTAGDAVIVKGSRSMKMEEAAEALAELMK